MYRIITSDFLSLPNRIVDEQGGLRLKRRCPLAHHQSKIRSEFCPVSSQPGAWCPNLGNNKVHLFLCFTVI